MDGTLELRTIVADREYQISNLKHQIGTHTCKVSGSISASSGRNVDFSACIIRTISAEHQNIEADAIAYQYIYICLEPPTLASMEHSRHFVNIVSTIINLEDQFTKTAIAVQPAKHATAPSQLASLHLTYQPPTSPSRPPTCPRSRWLG